MKLRSLVVDGFRSFSTQRELDLSTVPAGLYHVAGDNGAGKSSLFEALFWCLFSKTSRNLRGPSVRTWGSEAVCAVGVEMEEGTVLRTWSPNALTLNDTPVDQETLEQALGMTADVALSTFVFGQFTDFFLDLTPTARMDIYSTVLGLDLWERKSEQAKTMARTAEDAAVDLERQWTKLDTAQKTLLHMDYRAAIARWLEEQLKKLKDVEAGIAEIEKKIDVQSKRYEEAATEVAEAQRKYGAWQEAVDKAVARVNKTQRTAIEEDTRLQALQAQIKGQRQSIESFKLLGTGKCPECGQEVGARHAEKHVAALTARLEEVQAQCNAQQAVQQKAHKEDREAVEASKACGWGDHDLPLRKQKVEALASKLADLNKQRFALILSQTAMKKEVNPFVAQMEADKKAAAALEKKADAVGAELKDMRNLCAKFSFWIKGFKDVRFAVMQESLAQLNAEANECLHQLGLAGWHLQFMVERETKSKTVKRGFMCQVRSPHTADAVPWEAWCGGESQRLRLAAQLGVANMLTSRSGQEFNVEFWDEPTTWLSATGVKDLLEVLRDRAQRYNRKIFVADHRALDYAFDGVLRVVKEAGGTNFAWG